VIDPDVVAELVGRRRHREAIEELTEREREVLQLMAQGRTNSAIGSRLHLSPKTVEAHIRNILYEAPVGAGRRRPSACPGCAHLPAGMSGLSWNPGVNRAPSSVDR